MNERESFKSRMGFILVSAGCAIGIGNVWRFPYIAGKYGGAVFVLFYMIFLFAMGWPIMTMELSIGRGSKKSAGEGMAFLGKSKKWKWYGLFAYMGCFILMMYYNTVSGWMMAYIYEMARGKFTSVGEKGASKIFIDMIGNPSYTIFWMILSIVIGFLVVGKGLQNGVEKITKPMMISLFGLMTILAFRSFMLPGGENGLAFYLLPDIKRALDQGILNVISAAMGQAFFTLSLGVGAIAIFGSYIGKDHSVPSEARTIILLDTFVALMSGLIIFPACFAYNVNPGSGPSLIFIALPEVFSRMPGGRLWGTIFFVFMSFASLSTVIAVFENLVSIFMETFSMGRKKAVVINALLVTLFSIPCPLGFNILSNIHPMGKGSTIMDLEDFIVSNNMIPIGTLIIIIFCVSKKYGWGFKNFIEEANTGDGAKFSKKFEIYFKTALPILIILIIISGYCQLFGKN